MKVKGINVEFLHASAAKFDNTGGKVVCITIRGLDPENPFAPVNLLVPIEQGKRLYNELWKALNTIDIGNTND